MKALIALLVLTAGSPAVAQQIELAPLAGYSTSASIDKRAPGVDDLSIDGGFTWGGAGTWFVTDHLGVEALWSRHATRLSMSTQTGSAELFRLTTNQAGGNVVYQFGQPAVSWHPFAFAGVAATMFDADDLERDTKAAWALGGGLKWFLQRHVGVKGQGRYARALLGDEDAAVCAPFGFCQQRLKHLEFTAGAVFRF